MFWVELIRNAFEIRIHGFMSELIAPLVLAAYNSKQRISSYKRGLSSIFKSAHI